MSFTQDLKLPTYEELECPVVNVSSAALRAGSFHLAKYCDLQFKVSLVYMNKKKKGFSFCYLGIYVMSTGWYKMEKRIKNGRRIVSYFSFIN